MTDIAIRATNIAKSYIIRHNASDHVTLAETVLHRVISGKVAGFPTLTLSAGPFVPGIISTTVFEARTEFVAKTEVVERARTIMFRQLIISSFTATASNPSCRA